MSRVSKRTFDGHSLCIQHLLGAQVERSPDAIAVVAPGRKPLTYRRLFSHMEDIHEALNAVGVRRNDRVALVLPNGPEMAVAFVAVAASAASAPLNPAYRANEFDFSLAALKAKAVIIQTGMNSPAREVARVRGIPVLELSPLTDAEAGIFTLAGDRCSYAAQNALAEPDHVALVLQTSGTTSRPRIVPLTQTNICLAALNNRSTLELVENDRYLNVMPMFHAHSLLLLLSSWLTGASVVCPPSFEASRFFKWMEEFRPTWYSAAPTLHQAILAQAAHNAEIIARCPLRLIRSTTSALAPQVMAELERVFQVPAIEAYGMTEAPSPVTVNPLPPGKRKAGSVGLPAGPEVAIMDQAGKLLPPAETGEVVIRGANVMPGYDDNLEANNLAFTNGWFRSGDQGFFDDEGYLHISGRLKEIINRGGEKISPREVDEVLMDHPAVLQAVTFAVPHATLGEDIAAAIVLRENASVTDIEIRRFAAARLADFKVPRQVLIVEEIPRGPTGKLKRIGLAERLGLVVIDQGRGPGGSKFAGPRTTVEEQLAAICAGVLQLKQVGIYDNFFLLGGHSVLATQVISRIRAVFGVELPLRCLFETPSVADLAVAVMERQAEREGSETLVQMLAEL